MKRFSFNLQQLLNLRKRQRDWAETQVRRTAHEVDIARSHLRACEKDLDVFSSQLVRPGQRSPKTLASISQLLTVCQSRREAMSAVQAKHQEAVEQLRQTNATVEALETLRADQLNAHLTEERKKLQIEQEFRSLTSWQSNVIPATDMDNVTDASKERADV